MSAPLPLPFSKVRHAAGLAFLSGDLPLNPGGDMPTGIAAQTELTLSRISATLDNEGLTLADVVAVTAYLTHAEDFAEFNTAYRAFFAEPLPTRTTVIAQLALPGARVEITVVAAARNAA